MAAATLPVLELQQEAYLVHALPMLDPIDIGADAGCTICELAETKVTGEEFQESASEEHHQKIASKPRGIRMDMLHQLALVEHPPMEPQGRINT